MSGEKLKELSAGLTKDHIVYSIEQTPINTVDIPGVARNNSERVLVELYRHASAGSAMGFILTHRKDYAELTILTVYS